MPHLSPHMVTRSITRHFCTMYYRQGYFPSRTEDKCHSSPLALRKYPNNTAAVQTCVDIAPCSTQALAPRPHRKRVQSALPRTRHATMGKEGGGGYRSTSPRGKILKPGTK